jgi:hypothetical protein
MLKLLSITLSVVCVTPAMPGAATPIPPLVARLLETAEEDAFWHDVTIRLDDALPNSHPKLDDQLELYLGLGTDGKWRKYVMGFSAFFEPAPMDSRGRTYTRHLYSWMDAEGELKSAVEEGGTVRLRVDLILHDDPWIAGGDLTLDITLSRTGAALAGSYTGTFNRRRDGAAGPKGVHPITGAAVGSIRQKLWPSPVADHEPLKANEHPRLMFRAADLPRLKKRRETPDGTAMFERLKRFASTDRPHLWTNYAYGLLYQLTGEQVWADKAAALAEVAIKERRRFDRYGWFTRDGGYMRIGPSVAATAHAYDMCFHAWTPEFRQWVARSIQDRIYPNLVLEYDLKESDGQLSHRSNHYGLWQGGAGQAILAILGDDGVDPQITRRAHRIFQRRLKRAVERGFGDHGWFWEGTFCGRFPTLIGLTGYLQALRVAEGRDYVANCSEAQWLCTTWLYQAYRAGSRVHYKTYGMYSTFKWDHFTGDFSRGFGIMVPEHKAAALWFYQKVIEPNGVKTYDAGKAPQAAYAFVNWPIGTKPRDPAEVLGHVMYDREGGFWCLRSSFNGDADVVASMYKATFVMARGTTRTFPVAIPPDAKVTHFVGGPAQKTVEITARYGGQKGVPGGTVVMGADFTGLSGAPFLLAGTKFADGAPPVAASGTSAVDAKKLPPAIRAMVKKQRATGGSHTFVLGGRQFHLMTVQDGAAPEAKLVGEGVGQRIAIGKRRIGFDGEKIVFGVIDR